MADQPGLHPVLLCDNSRQSSFRLLSKPAQRLVDDQRIEKNQHSINDVEREQHGGSRTQGFKASKVDLTVLPSIVPMRRDSGGKPSGQIG